MKVDQIVYSNVDPKTGSLSSGGAVRTKPWIGFSENQGCGLKGCDCSMGYWLTVASGIDASGGVHVLKVTFEDKKEFQNFLKIHELEGDL